MTHSIYDLHYCANNCTDWTTLATDLTNTEYDWNTTLYDDGNSYLIRVTVSDGSLTGTDMLDDVFSLGNYEETSHGFPVDPALLLLIGGVVLVVLVIIVVISKRGSGKK